MAARLWLQVRYDSLGNPGPEVTINTTGAVLDYSPSITVLADCGWVVTWMGDGQDGDGYGIYQRRFEADGTPSDAMDVQVNITTISDQQVPVVTGLADGGWVIAWQSVSAGGDLEIFQQRFDEFGVAQSGVDMLVNNAAADDQGVPSITALSNGGWVVTWESGSASVPGSYDIYQKVYDKDGNVALDESLVNSTMDGDQRHPFVTALSDGGWVISWEGSAANDPDGIYQKVFHFANNAPMLSGTKAVFGDGVEDTAYTILDSQLRTGFTDDDGDALVIMNLVSDHGDITDNGDGTYTLVPDENYNGIVTLTYILDDGYGGKIIVTNTLNLVPVNDVPTVGGVIAGDVTEDDPDLDKVSGSVLFNDPDANETGAVADTIASDYGIFTVDAAGAWSFELDNSKPAVQALGEGVTHVEIFTVTSKDLSTSQQVTITITGSNDVAIVDATVVFDDILTEDDGNDNVGNGVVTFVDADAGESGAVGYATSNDYGTFTVDAGGAWSFVLDNSKPAVQALGDGVTHVETFAVTSIDGTVSQDVTITITGSNDAASSSRVL